MSTIDPYIVKVTCDEFVGSGILFSPKNDSQQIYIVSARHNFVDDGGVMRSAIKIDFWGKTLTYILAETDRIYLGENNEYEDCALIILPVNMLAEDIDLSKSPQPATIEIDKKNECLTSGFPKFTQNNLKRTLYQCQILNDKDYPDNLQVEVNDPVSHQYNADDLVEGYSGSPIFITDSNQTSILGLFSQYDEVTRRISAISISFINTLLKRNGISFLTIEQVEVDPGILEDIKKIHDNGKRILNRIKNRIGDVHITRPDLEIDLEKIVSKQALTVIYGKPGVGKSAFAKKVLSGLENFSLITLQGEQLDKVSINDIFKSPEIGISGDLNEILSSPALKKNKIILIDSIEKLIETRYAETIIDFFTLLTERDDLRLVLTCRSYAVEHLKIRFLQQYKDLYAFEVPLLNDTELDIVSSKYGFLGPLLKNVSLRKILQIPFNIDKATLVQNGVLDRPLTSEFDFKQIMWEYVIEGKETEHDINRQQLRGNIFSKIAYKRAEQMVTYVEIETKHQDILSALEKDQLIEKDLFVSDRYSASHDIYEDWALTRKIESYYRNYQTDLVINVFFYSVGYAPAFRRAFRIWISEKLQVIDFNIQDFILSCLSDVNVEHHWKDEVLIAIMQSPYSKKFLFDNKGVLFNDGLYLFKRCVLLLHVSCQSPDLSYLGLLNEKEKNTIYMSSWLKPYGEGWLNMIDFMLENLNELNGEFKLVVKLVLTWGKSFVNKDIGDGAVSSGLILCRYFEYHLAHLNDTNISLLSGDEKSSAIQMLLRLAKVIPEEVKSILDNCIENIDKNSDENYYFWDDFKSSVLSFNHGYPICELFPNLVLKIAEAEWFYYLPTEEELKEHYSSSPLGYVGHRPSTEEQFGITNDRDYRYSPASAYQTTVWHLLRYAPESTLDFIVRLFNHSVDAFFESDFNQSELFGSEERNIIKFAVDDNKSIEVKGSELLWCIYRGKYNITSPYLLQSVLMALEKWMLSTAEIVDAVIDDKESVRIKNFEDTFKFLLTYSRSASIHAVLISVATAYPELCKKIVQPILKVRSFYRWDLVRCGRERSKRYMFFDDPILVKKEREESDKMPHRTDEMEALIRNLSLTSESENIYKILDDFYARDSLDEKWKLALNRMDLRKAKVVKATENMVVLMPEIDEELKPFVAKAEKKQNELRPVQIAGVWALNKWEGEPIENDNYAEWKNHYENVLKAPKDNKTVQLFNNPGTLAAVGIRYFFDDLSKSEKNWCVEKIFYIVNKEIGKGHNPFNLESDENYSAFDPDHAFEVLIDLVRKCNGNVMVQAKELIFASLIFIDNDIQREKLIKSFKSDLWKSDKIFALNCVAGLIEYAKISELKNRISYFQPGLRSPGAPAWRKSKLETLFINIRNKIKKNVQTNKFLEKRRIKNDEVIRNGWIELYNSSLQRIVNNVVTGKLEINYNKEKDIKLSSYNLIKALELLPFDLNNKAINNYYDFLIDYFLHQVSLKDANYQEKIDFSLQQKFTKYFANYLLVQPNDEALAVFKKLSDWMLLEDSEKIVYRYNDNRFKLIESILEDMLSSVYRENSISESFWVIWEYLFDNFSKKSRYFNKILLLNPGYQSQQSLNALAGKKEIFKKAILELNDIENAIWLLVGSGFDELLPEGIEWYAELLKEGEMKDANTIHLSEKLVIEVYYNKEIRKNVKAHMRLKSCFISILDKLIDKNSAAAYLIREDFISLK